MFTVSLKPYTVDGCKISPKDELIEILKFWQLYISSNRPLCNGSKLHKKITLCNNDQVTLSDFELITLKDIIDMLLRDHPDGLNMCNARLNVLNSRILGSFVSELRKLHPEITAEGGELRGIGLNAAGRELLANGDNRRNSKKNKGAS